MERGGSDGMERWRGEGVVGSDGGGKGGVGERDGGEREEWEAWGLMEGEGVLLGHCRPCVRSLSCPGAFVMCGWRVVTV